MRMVRTATLAIACEMHGPEEGIPLVLLHGYPDDARCYDAAVGLLAPTGRFRIVVPYLRGYGPTRFLDGATMRSGQQAALGADLRDLLDALALRGAIIAGMDWGGRAACIVAALWPDRVRGLVSCGGYNIQDLSAIGEPAAPGQAVLHWYQWYFATARGLRALAVDPGGIARECWRLWSPRMAIDGASFARTEASWRNSDHAAVVVHSYRHRHGEAEGDPEFDAIERALLAQPRIDVPTIVLDPAEDGVHPVPREDPWASHFGGDYERRWIGRTGHFVPREQPALFAAAIGDLADRTASC